jgi:hypothetical protein
MLSGHHSHAPCCEKCMLDGLYHTNYELPPTNKAFGGPDHS